MLAKGGSLVEDWCRMRACWIWCSICDSVVVECVSWIGKEVGVTVCE